MRIGITLPQFRDDPEPALATARAAEAAGLDGVFAFDHLWPIGRPERPALHGLTLLGALAVETGRLALGSLVARVGVLPDAVLAHGFATLQRMAGERLIAGVGVGDRLSRPENLAYGVPFRPLPERVDRLGDVCRRLRARGITTWAGGRSAAVAALAAREADALNLWGVTAAEVAAAAAGGVPVTWAGQVDLSRVGGGELAAFLGDVRRAGATWAVVAPLGVPWGQAVHTIAAAGAPVD